MQRRICYRVRGEYRVKLFVIDADPVWIRALDARMPDMATWCRAMGAAVFDATRTTCRLYRERSTFWAYSAGAHPGAGQEGLDVWHSNVR